VKNIQHILFILLFITNILHSEEYISYCFKSPYILVNGEDINTTVKLLLKDMTKDSDDKLSKILYVTEDGEINSFELICYKKSNIYQCHVDITDGGKLLFNTKKEIMTMEYVGTSIVWFQGGDEPDRYELDKLDVSFPKNDKRYGKYRMWIKGHGCTDSEEEMFEKRYFEEKEYIKMFPNPKDRIYGFKYLDELFVEKDDDDSKVEKIKLSREYRDVRELIDNKTELEELINLKDVQYFIYNKKRALINISPKIPKNATGCFCSESYLIELNKNILTKKSFAWECGDIGGITSFEDD